MMECNAKVPIEQSVSPDTPYSSIELQARRFINQHDERKDNESLAVPAQWIIDSLLRIVCEFKLDLDHMTAKRDEAMGHLKTLLDELWYSGRSQDDTWACNCCGEAVKPGTFCNAPACPAVKARAFLERNKPATSGEEKDDE